MFFGVIAKLGVHREEKEDVGKHMLVFYKERIPDEINKKYSLQ